LDMYDKWNDCNIYARKQFSLFNFVLIYFGAIENTLHVK
jgi:hypothetical protein